MAKYASNAVLDALLDKVATGTILAVCSSEPSNRTEAVTTYKLADVAIDSSDFTKSDGGTSGRKLTIAEQAGVPVDVSGLAVCVAICDDTELLCITTCSPQTVTDGNTITVPSWDIEVKDPN